MENSGSEDSGSSQLPESLQQSINDVWITELDPASPPIGLLKERIPDNYDSRYARDILGDEEICMSC
ncbi:hypothetical protein D5086_030214 [Populus alba]|uniref:Uncharacterized protein n=1 Tax=Populus alba TaxID=43335 RepID=A0ACC4AMY1_POPAL